MSELRG